MAGRHHRRRAGDSSLRLSSSPLVRPNRAHNLADWAQNLDLTGHRTYCARGCNLTLRPQVPGNRGDFVRARDAERKPPAQPPFPTVVPSEGAERPVTVATPARDPYHLYNRGA